MENRRGRMTPEYRRCNQIATKLWCLMPSCVENCVTHCRRFLHPQSARRTRERDQDSPDPRQTRRIHHGTRKRARILRKVELLRLDGARENRTNCIAHQHVSNQCERLTRTARHAISRLRIANLRDANRCTSTAIFDTGASSHLRLSFPSAAQVRRRARLTARPRA